MGMSVNRSEGLHALVTGGGSGIGASVAHALATRGMRVSVLGRRLDALQSVCGGKSRSMQAVVADVSERSSVDAALEQARNRIGPIAILVNNAGQAGSAPFHKTDASLWNNMLAVNLSGTFRCSQAVLQDMLNAKWGRIINVSSTAGLLGYAYVAAYCAAKHGVIGLSRAMALEYAKKGITVNAVCPGYTETDLLREGIANVMAKTGSSMEEVMAEFCAGNPQGRLVQSEEAADAVGWLCSLSASSINGQSIAVCGGEVMH